MGCRKYRIQDYFTLGSPQGLSDTYAYDATHPLKGDQEFLQLNIPKNVPPRSITLVYYNYRYYNPRLGRWTKRDPIAEYGGYNLYAMVANDSVNLLDHLGREVTSANFKQTVIDLNKARKERLRREREENYTITIDYTPSLPDLKFKDYDYSNVTSMGSEDFPAINKKESPVRGSVYGIGLSVSANIFIEDEGYEVSKSVFITTDCRLCVTYSYTILKGYPADSFLEAFGYKKYKDFSGQRIEGPAGGVGLSPMITLSEKGTVEGISETTGASLVVFPATASLERNNDSATLVAGKVGVSIGLGFLERKTINATGCASLCWAHFSQPIAEYKALNFIKDRLCSKGD